MSEANGRQHLYNADAKILEGHLRIPLIQDIKPQAPATLTEKGGYVAQQLEDYWLESVISFKHAYTQVAGNPDPKPGHGWSTLSTTVVEGLQVLEVLTADKVVGQIITEHPLEGYVPSISFLGTRFENLRIAGHPVKLDLDLEIFGPKPANDGAYTHEPYFLKRVSSQYNRILEHENLPEDLLERYKQFSADLGKSEAVECSLVNHAAGSYPGPSFGHVIRIPNFGTITLAKLTVTHENPKQETGVPTKTTLRLTMLDLKLGCAIDGDIPIGGGGTNGTTVP
ncbi:MAG: hypothetical protein ABSG51_03610 [Terracidiphilus sp.]